MAIVQINQMRGLRGQSIETALRTKGVIAIPWKNKYYIVDGTCRAARAKERGDTEMEINTSTLQLFGIFVLVYFIAREIFK